MWDAIKGAGNWIVVGPFLSNSDGVTHISSVGLANADHAIIVKQTGSMQIVAANSFTAVQSGAGMFRLYLTDSNCDTYGMARISIVDSSFHLPVFDNISIQDSAYWGLKYSAVAPALQANVNSIAAQVNSNSNAIGLRPTSATWYAAITSLDVRLQGVTSQTMSQTIDGTVTFIQSQRLGLAVLTGITSGGGTNTLTFRDVGDTKDRLVVTVDSNQNRTSITTRDGS